MRRFWAGFLTGMLMLGLANGCGRVIEGAISAAPAFFITDQQEVALGLQAAQRIVQQTPVSADTALKGYVSALGQRLAEASGRTGIPWTFTVLDAATPDAFSLPGGFVFVTTGMLKLMGNEAELACVLGHEVGHVAAKHSVAMIREAALAQGIEQATIGQNAGMTSLLAQAVATLVQRGYGRSKELEADKLGARYASGLGYAPQSLGEFLTRLTQATGDAPSWLQPLATHPALQERLNQLQQVIQSEHLTGSQTDPGPFQQATAGLR